MLSDSIRILDLDASLIGQKELLERYKHEIIDLQGLGPSARMWISEGTSERFKESIAPSCRSAVTFLGSGDFHHLSNILISQFHQPLCVIVFDLHPDWDILPPSGACGSWVNSLLKHKNILRCLLIGVSSQDISGFWIHSADLSSLKDNRVQIYPYRHKPTRVFFRGVPANTSLKTQRGIFFRRIYWSELKDREPGEFLCRVIEHLPVKDVYISLDKDCLTNKFALTNWEEGQMPLDELLLMLKVIREKLNIVGMDITGDYSRVLIKGLWKKVVSSLDHPKESIAAKLPVSYVSALNAQTNIRILDALGVGGKQL